MTEQEYTNLANLTKVRAAYTILGGMVPNEGQHEELYRNVMANLAVWEREMGRALRVKSDAGSASGSTK